MPPRRSTRRSASPCRRGMRAGGWCGSGRRSTRSSPPTIIRRRSRACSTEALVLTALLGATLKDAGGQLTLQAQTEAGIVDLLVADYKGGELRGYVRFDAERLAEQPSQPSLFALFGKGYLAITFDQAVSNERYQGIVPLEGGSLAEAVEHFFVQSEQIPSLVRVAVGEGGHVAGGILLQHLPEGEEGRERLHARLDHPEWEHVRAARADDPRRRARRSGAAARDPALAAVPRGGRDPPARHRAARQGLPLLPRLCARRDRPLRRRGARGDGRRRGVHQRRLRILLARLPDPAGRPRACRSRSCCVAANHATISSPNRATGVAWLMRASIALLSCLAARRLAGRGPGAGAAGAGRARPVAAARARRQRDRRGLPRRSAAARPAAARRRSPAPARSSPPTRMR